MYSAFLCLALCLYSVDADSDDKKWVWSSARRSGSADPVYTGLASSSSYTSALVLPSKSLFRPASGSEEIVPQSTKLRYEVNEPSDYPRPPSRPPSAYPEEQYRPSQTTINGYRPSRPDSFNPNDSYRPINRPGNNYKPTGGYRPPENSYRPTDNFRPGQGSGYRPSGGDYRPTNGPGGRPILTGPVPSWEQDGNDRYRDYDRCKCVHSFNCNTPGIQFGSCDVDKQYCCYKDHNSNRPFSSGSSGSERPRPVLAGPGGPVDRPNLYRPSKTHTDRFQDRPSRPYSEFNRYSNGYKDSNLGGQGLEEAYKKGLESAIHQTYESPSRFDNRRDYSGEYSRGDSSDFNRRPNSHSKYGLYGSHSDFSGGRSSNKTILSEKV